MNVTLENYAKILEDSDEYNVIIKIGQEPNLKEFNAHSIILRAQSPYFHRALSTEWRKEENGKILFEKPNVSPKIFEFILKYLYSGDIISLNNFNYSEFTDIIIAADEFILHDLVSYIEQKLLMSYNNWSKKCFVQIYKCVLEQEFCKELQTFFEERINEKPSIILESEDFTLLDEEMIIRFLRLEDHCMNEIDVWNNVRTWAIAQNPTITFDGNPRTWTEENFLSLKETLSQCINFIKFPSVTSEEFYAHVKPFRQIFPPDFYEDLLWKYINNDEPKPHSSDTTKVKSYSDVAAQNIQNIQNIWNTPNIRQNSSIQIDSDIIGNNHAALISRWIRRTMNKSCLGFNLIMNSSIDGFSSQIFNRKCDEIRPTLVILTVEGTNEILGGFNPLRWGSRGECWKDTRDSFIFSFPDGQDHTNHRYSRVNPVCEKKAIYRSGSNGPNFGGGDLTLGRQTSLKRDCICVQTNYLVPIRDDFDYFRASSYEIFEVLI
ncbi:unnamed protein product [Rhizophagus irregularis]|uniref:Kelch-like protein 17 n=1 Tax=Rhizophagus irregularis TaxID=588596 RepID=A0A2I1G394_9GLOM|nr:hypothetical protein RhiirA4_395550 [Rhizophagus irregularis]CAB4412429.1 unnamed protein product [Rhizophagus irregularis]